MNLKNRIIWSPNYNLFICILYLSNTHVNILYIPTLCISFKLKYVSFKFIRVYENINLNSQNMKEMLFGYVWFISRDKEQELSYQFDRFMNIYWIWRLKDVDLQGHIYRIKLFKPIFLILFYIRKVNSVIYFYIVRFDIIFLLFFLNYVLAVNFQLEQNLLFKKFKPTNSP